MSRCEHCGSIAAHAGVCPTVKAVEYYANGKVKRVEYKCAPDYNGSVDAFIPLFLSPSKGDDGIAVRVF